MKILLLTYYSLGTAYHALDLFLHFSLPCSLPPSSPSSSLGSSPPPAPDKYIQGALEKVELDSIIYNGFLLGKNSISFFQFLMSNMPKTDKIYRIFLSNESLVKINGKIWFPLYLNSLAHISVIR